MATILYLDNVQVYTDELKSIKIVKENPVLTNSETYTLDVTLPMTILENRLFFKNINRPECSKTQRTAECRLSVDNKDILTGTARIIQVNNDEIKVQLLGGNSAWNNKIQDLYIDRIPGMLLLQDYTAYLSYTAGYERIPVYNETTESLVNTAKYWEDDKRFYMNWLHIAFQPNLTATVKAAVAVAGYKIARCDFDISPWNRLQIANADHGESLPHWTCKEFFKEVCNFFSCIMLVDQDRKEISFINIASFYENADIIEITPTDEYQADFGEKDYTVPITSQNVAFGISSSKAHDYDYIDKETLSSLAVIECGTEQEAHNRFAELPAEDRKKYLYKTNTGYYAAGTRGLIKVGHFSDLVRNPDSSDVLTLRICPVAIRYSQDALTWHVGGIFSTEDYPMSCWVPSIEGPDNKQETDTDTTTEETALNIIENRGSDNSRQQEDRMEVFFMEDIAQTSETQEGSYRAAPFRMPFTDYQYRGGENHSHWSLSLNASSADYYLGQLHRLPFTINTKVKTVFKFLSDHIPNPTSVFNIRNKLYLCEKIEANIERDRMKPLMTGYFYELETS